MFANVDRIGAALDRLVAEVMPMLPRIAMTLLIAVAAYALGKLGARASVRLLRRAKSSRADALAPLVRGTVFVAIVGVGVVMALGQLGINVAALIASAGVVGIAVGFGAQTLVKDCITGFFLIVDDVVTEGDMVTIDAVGGVVERVGLRILQVRSFDGQLWYIPNSEIRRVGNWRREWARALVEVSVAYEHDVERAMGVLGEVGAAWAAANEALVVEPPEVHGILKMNASDITIRLVVKIKNAELKLWGIERELRLRTKAAFDREGVEIPFPRQVVYHRQEEGAALAFAPAKAPPGPAS